MELSTASLAAPHSNLIAADQLRAVACIIMRGLTALQGGPGADSMRRPARCSDGSMASPQDCIEFAKQCERLASLCEDDPQLREHLIDLAREWMTMAEQNTADA